MNGVGVDILERVVIPPRLSLIVRGQQTVGYNPNVNIWHRLNDQTAEVLRWLRSGRDRSVLPVHLTRRFGLDNAEGRLNEILKWAILRELLYLDEEPALPISQLPPHPLSTVYWICTQACNLRCSYCYQDASIARKHELSTAEGCDLVDQAVEADIRTFVFTGGEPFHRRDLLEIARYSKRRGLKTNVISNGGLITSRRVKDIVEIFDKVTVSLDHGVADHHDRARGKGSWRKAVRAIDLLLDEGVNVDINSVLSRPGLRDLNKLLEFVQRRPLGQHRIVPQSPMARGVNSRWDELTPEERLGLDDNLYYLRERLDASLRDRRPSDDDRPSISKGACRTHCGAGLSEVAVDPEGWVYPCKLLQTEENRVANIRQKRLIEIFSGDPALARFKRPFVSTLRPCTTCIIKNDCGGGCRGIHSSFSLDWTVSDPLFCAQLRRSFELNVFASTGNVPPRQPARFFAAKGVTGAPGAHLETITISIDQVGRRSCE